MWAMVPGIKPDQTSIWIERNIIHTISNSCLGYMPWMMNGCVAHLSETQIGDCNCKVRVV